MTGCRNARAQIFGILKCLLHTALFC